MRRKCLYIRKLLIVFFWTLFIHPTASSQTLADIEMRIERLLTNSAGYYNIEKILTLIEWESDIIFNVPCVSPLELQDFRNITVSSKFGLRYHPIKHEYKHHSGIDLPATQGDLIYCSANGVVTASQYSSSLGHYVKVAHEYGFESMYGHLSERLVNVGDTLQICTPVGRAGSTGLSTATHLHYEVKKNGKSENSYDYCFLYLKLALQQRKE